MAKASTFFDLLKRYQKQWDDEYSRFCVARLKPFKSDDEATPEQCRCAYLEARRDLRAPRLMEKLAKRIMPRGKAFHRIR